MARIAYDDAAAAAFAATRHVPDDGLTDWRAAVTRHLRPEPGMRVVDVGAGTGAWAQAFTDWYGVRVTAIEPSPAMRARCPYPGPLPGHAADLPLSDGAADAAWLSTVVHHIPDLGAAAAELRRVVRPGGPVLIRSAFPGRHEAITLTRYFPEATAVLDTFPSVEQVSAAFAAAGFPTVTVERVAQISAPSLTAAVAALRRDAHTLLTLISDEHYEAGMTRLRAAAAGEPGPVVDTLDLLVLR